MEENAYQSPAVTGCQTRSTAWPSCRVVFGWSVISAAMSLALFLVLGLSATSLYPWLGDDAAIVLVYASNVFLMFFPIGLLTALVSGVAGVCSKIAGTMTPQERKIVAVTLGSACVLATIVDAGTWLITGENSVPLFVTIGLLMPFAGYFFWSSWRAAIMWRNSSVDQSNTRG